MKVKMEINNKRMTVDFNSNSEMDSFRILLQTLYKSSSLFSGFDIDALSLDHYIKNKKNNDHIEFWKI